MTVSTDMDAVRLEDGRRLTYQAIGSADGFPVVYMHGAIGSPRWRTVALDSVVAALGIRYVALNRPGFGGSDHCPGRTVAGYASDVRGLADALGWTRFSVIGVSAGAPFALASAWGLERPGGRLRPRQPARAAAAAVTALPRPGGGLPAASRGPADLRRRALRVLHARTATAPRNMVEDYEVCRRPWGFDPADVTVPVALWHGVRDRLVPARHALELAAALPACATHLEPRAGHFFFGRRVGDIIASVL